MNLWKAEERKTVILSAFLVFLIIAAFVVLKSARDALVLSKYPARTLPYFMVTTTLTAGLVVATYLRLYAALTLGRAVGVSLVAFAAGTLLFWLGITLGCEVTIPVLYVWVGVFGTLAPVQAWSIISQRLLIRQAKRVLGIIGAGGIAGSMAGGLFARWIALGWNVSALLPTAAVLILLALFLSLALSAPHQNRESSSRGTEPPQVRQRFVALVLVVVGTSALVSTFVDFQFKVTAQRELATAEALAVFFGSFYAYLGGVTLLFQVLVTLVLMRRLKVSAALSFLPLGLIVGNALVLAAGSLWSTIVLKGNEQLFKHSVDRSALEVLYLAIPNHAKIRLRSFMDTIGVRISEGVGAILLVLLFSVGNLPPSVLAPISMSFLAIWIGSTILLGREYPQVLENAIQRREVDLAAAKATFFTSDFYRLLPELLQSSEKRTMMDLLELLETSDERLGPYLGPLLQHEDADVRLKALQLLFTQDDDLSHQVEQLLDDADRRVRVEAIHYLCLRSPVGPMEKLCLFLGGS